jgi:protein-S-isoprenylcysteine O-methyltransferase Ste14
MLKAMSLAGYAMMVAALLGLIWMKSFLSPNPAVIAIQILSLAFFLWARITFGRRSFHLAANPTEGGLVTSGPYRFVRHPIYTAMCVCVWAGVLAHWSWATASCGLLIVAAALLRIYCEEKLVSARYPEYLEYSKTTARLIPGLF